eukprot:3101320-Prymnesium_polylepis.1
MVARTSTHVLSWLQPGLSLEAVRSAPLVGSEREFELDVEAEIDAALNLDSSSSKSTRAGIFDELMSEFPTAEATVSTPVLSGRLQFGRSIAVQSLFAAINTEPQTDEGIEALMMIGMLETKRSDSAEATVDDELLGEL